MAQRATAKVKSMAAGRSTGTGTPALAELGVLKSRIEQLERERDTLNARVAAAESRIQQLSEARDAAVNRIDWVLDSLHNVLEGRSGGSA